jgi:hypothetical protein
MTGRRPIAFAKGMVKKLARPTKSEGSDPNMLICVAVGFPGITGKAFAMSALLCPWGPGGGAGTVPPIWLSIFGLRPEYSKMNTGIMPAIAACTVRPMDPTAE